MRRFIDLQNVYHHCEANSFASAAASLASSTGSPWAAYDADYYAAQATHVTAVSGGAKANAIAQASAQKAAEIAQTNAETIWRNANATSDGTLNTSIAGAHLGFATAQSTAHAASGGNELDHLPSRQTNSPGPSGKSTPDKSPTKCAMAPYTRAVTCRVYFRRGGRTIVGRCRANSRLLYPR